LRLLLDTHALLWWLADPDELGDEARSAIVDPVHDVFVSAASTWEIAIKGARGKLRVPDDLADRIAFSSFAELPVTIGHSIEAGGLPRHHADPFDRMLVAQARVEGLTVVTRDRALTLYDVATLAA
jgi:PIN domain nuclease of toxin-antitoxin system